MYLLSEVRVEDWGTLDWASEVPRPVVVALLIEASVTAILAGAPAELLLRTTERSMSVALRNYSAFAVFADGAWACRGS